MLRLMYQYVKKQRILLSLIPILLVCSIKVPDLCAQTFGHNKTTVKSGVDTTLLRTLVYRNIGPYMGGRAVAVAGIAKQPRTYYAGGTGGGVLKTETGGKTWENVSDGYFKTGSVGAIAVAPSEPKVVYVGMGETDIRSNMSPGDGLYKSTDGGNTWKHMGLKKTQFIGDIVVHPNNSNILWVAALGHAFGKKGNKERGVYKSTDGGKTWKKVLYHGKHTGAVDLTIDPSNPRILYAALWQTYRVPWKLSSGGPGSGLYKSTDGGETWKNISNRPGLPRGINGKIGVDISPANPDRVYSIIENKNGGLFRSDDAGETWKRVNKSGEIRQRAWYFTDVFADPKDENTVYVINVVLQKSTDGGHNLEPISTGEASDMHDLWIAPDKTNRMIVATDKSALVTYNGGGVWSSLYNVATGQPYHVSVDNRFPYRVYGSSQDNGSYGIKSRTGGDGIRRSDWQFVAGGESGFVAPDPKNPYVTYGGGYGGAISRYNEKTMANEKVNVWPDYPMGHGAADLKYRFNWTFPLLFSPNDPNELYATSQYLHRSTDGGKSWSRISPDLTRNDKSKQQPSGGPISFDNTSVEYYNVIFSFAESPVQKGLLWAGTMGGLVHVSRDNGKTWQDVTPKNMPESMVSIIDPSSFDGGTAYMAVTRYMVDDFTPMLYKTDNYGKSWNKIIDGIPKKDFTLVIREDPFRKGLLFTGTKTGVFVSFDDGEQWQSLQLNLPAMPVNDMKIQKRAKDLVLATRGRSFWIFDELGVLEQIDDKVKESNTYLFKPEDTYLIGRLRGPANREKQNVGKNPDDGVVVHYKLKNPGDKEVQLQFLEDDGTIINTYSSKKEQKEDNEKEKNSENQDTKPKFLDPHIGLNKFVWHMRYKGATKLNRIQVFWGGSRKGPTAIPGTYKVRLIVNGRQVMVQPFTIKRDPRIDISQEDLEAQFNLQQKIVAKLDTTQKSINKILEVRKKIEDNINKGTLSNQDKDLVNSLLDQLSNIQSKLMSPKAYAMEDVLSHPIKLDAKLAYLSNSVGTGKNRPTKQEYQVYQVLSNKVDVQLKKLNTLMKGKLRHLRLRGEINKKSIPFDR